MPEINKETIKRCCKKRKLKEVIGGKPRERNWVLFSKLYDHTTEIDQKYINTPHYMTESRWLPEWGMQEAVRELLANMIDQSRKVVENSYLEQQELQFSDAPGRLFVHVGDILLAEARWKEKLCMYVSSYVNGGIVKAKAVKGEYEKVKTQCIELINYGSELHWKAFHVGYSSKRDSKTMIGKHGEGLTGACVVLNRNGCNLSAECTHNGFTADVLNFDSAVHFQLQRRKPKVKDLPSCTVRFTIVFDPERAYTSPEQLMGSVRLSSTAAAAGITTTRGTLLTERTLRGKQFNRSIFVAEAAHCLFGYDFLDPDKTLLQGRDRNSHSKGSCTQECGLILSEAILQSEEVREEVLKCFLYSKRYDPNNPEQEERTEYDDIKDGRYLSEPAVQALRQQHPGGKNAIFCANTSGKLSEITTATGMNVVFAHRLLHNHAAVIDNFDTELVRDSREISEDSRIYAHRERIAALLRVTQLKQSRLVLPHGQTGFWIRQGVAYITSAEELGTAKDEGLTEAQEITLSRTLHACSVPLENAVKILRLLRNQPEQTTFQTSTANATVLDAALRANPAAKLSLRSGGANSNNVSPTSPGKQAPPSTKTPPTTATASNPMHPVVIKHQPTKMGAVVNPPAPAKHMPQLNATLTASPEPRDAQGESDAELSHSVSSYSRYEDDSEWLDEGADYNYEKQSGQWNRASGRLRKKPATTKLSTSTSESGTDHVNSTLSVDDMNSGNALDWNYDSWVVLHTATTTATTAAVTSAAAPAAVVACTTNESAKKTAPVTSHKPMTHAKETDVHTELQAKNTQRQAGLKDPVRPMGLLPQNYSVSNPQPVQVDAVPQQPVTSQHPDLPKEKSKPPLTQQQKEQIKSDAKRARCVDSHFECTSSENSECLSDDDQRDDNHSTCSGLFTEWNQVFENYLEDEDCSTCSAHFKKWSRGFESYLSDWKPSSPSCRSVSSSAVSSCHDNGAPCALHVCPNSAEFDDYNEYLLNAVVMVPPALPLHYLSCDDAPDMTGWFDDAVNDSALDCTNCWGNSPTIAAVGPQLPTATQLSAQLVASTASSSEIAPPSASQAPATAPTPTPNLVATTNEPNEPSEVQDDNNGDASELSCVIATPIYDESLGAGPERTDTPRFVLPDPPASISLGKGRPCVYRLFRNAATGVWLYSDSDKKKVNPSGRLAAQLEWCVPSSMDRHKLLLLSALVHIVVFTSTDASAALVFNSECNCVCVNLSSEGVNETVFKYFLRSQLKMYEFI